MCSDVSGASRVYCSCALSDVSNNLTILRWATVLDKKLVTQYKKVRVLLRVGLLLKNKQKGVVVPMKNNSQDVLLNI